MLGLRVAAVGFLHKNALCVLRGILRAVVQLVRANKPKRKAAIQACKLRGQCGLNLLTVFTLSLTFSVL